MYLLLHTGALQHKADLNSLVIREQIQCSLLHCAVCMSDLCVDLLDLAVIWLNVGLLLLLCGVWQRGLVSLAPQCILDCSLGSWVLLGLIILLCVTLMSCSLFPSTFSRLCRV